jgi:acetyltransferase-like isoleucine patch superfamily enzyme
MTSIDAPNARVGRNPRFGAGARITATDVSIGDDVELGEGVMIGCDRLVLESGVVIGAGTRIVAPDVRIGRNSVLGRSIAVAVNEYFDIGELAQIGDRLRVVGLGVRTGTHLWITDDVVIGGGGATGPRAFLRIGDRSAIMDRCLVNIGDTIEIGDDTALSNGVSVLTHATWHPALHGGKPLVGPVRIGTDTIVFINAVIAPNVVIGSHVTIGAGALVLADVPDRSTAAGNPARVFKGGPVGGGDLDPDRRDAIITRVLTEYVEVLPSKGVAVIERDDACARFVVEWNGAPQRVAYVAPADAPSAGADITLAFGPRAAIPPGACHFDLLARRMDGTPTALAEDLRDFLRRCTIRIFTDRPFRQLPLAAVARLSARLAGPR